MIEFGYSDGGNSLQLNSEYICKKLLGGGKACKTTLSLPDTMSKGESDRSCKHFSHQLPKMHCCHDDQNKHLARKEKCRRR